MNVDNHNFNITSCKFVNNTSDRVGGVSFDSLNSYIFISGSQFINNSASLTVGGMDITINNEYVIVEGCEFIGNVGNVNSGGLRIYQENLFIEVLNCLFLDNKALDEGTVRFNNYFIVSNNICFLLYN